MSGVWRYATTTLVHSNEIYPVFCELPVTGDAETHSACYNADGNRHADGHATQSGKIRYQRQARPLAVTSGHDFRLFEHIADMGIEGLGDDHLRATYSCEPFDPRRHSVERQVKSVTYHQACLEETAGGWYARVYVDL